MAVNKFSDSVSEILIEGHASSEWAPGTPAEEAFVKNLSLSQARSAAVLAFCLDQLAPDAVADWARRHLVAVGHSSARPIVVNGM